MSFGYADPFTSVEDAGICSNIDFFRETSDIPRQVIADAIERTLRPSPTALVGDPSGSIKVNLLPPASKYFNIINGLRKQASESSIPSRDIGGRSAPIRPYGAMPTTRPSSSSPYGGGSGSSSPYGGGGGSASAYGGGGGGGGSASSAYGGTSAMPRSYGGTARPVDTNPFAFLREINIPFEAMQHLSRSEQPVSIASFMRPEDDLKGPMMADYRRAYDNYRGSLPAEDVRNFGGGRGPSAPDFGGATMQQANAYQLVQLANMCEGYKARIRKNDEALGRKTPESVDQLSFVQLVEYEQRQRADLKAGMNSFIYSNGFIVAGGALAGALGGHTGFYPLDRYCNLSTLPKQLKATREQPWWNYAITQLSQDSALGESPLTAIALMMGMTLFSTIQDGISLHDAAAKKEEEEKEKQARARFAEVEAEATAAAASHHRQAEATSSSTATAPTPPAPSAPPPSRPFSSRRTPQDAVLRLPARAADSAKEESKSARVKEQLAGAHLPPSTGEEI